MQVKMNPETSLKDLFAMMDSIKRLGFECFLKGTGSGNVKLIIEVPLSN